MSKHLIDLKNITKTYDDTDVLKDINLYIRDGEFLTLLGPSGCGKTTMLRLIAGFTLPDNGQILVDGKDISGVPPYRRQVNTVFQKYALFPHLNVFDNIAFGLNIQKLPKDEIESRVNEMMELTPTAQIANRKYALEGYLAPDTYNIYLNESAESIIRRLLNQSEKVISNIYELMEQKKTNMLDPADEDATTDDIDLPGMELNQDQLFILASIIEKEAKPDDFARVSAVFHNRLERNMRLESCATVQYVLGTTRLALTTSDTSVDSPYNTYANEGLPVGPICNPSAAALYAAAFPDEECLSEGYLYFCSKDPTSGELQFSKTYEEHQAAVDMYRPLWIEYDNSQAAGGAGQGE